MNEVKEFLADYRHLAWLLDHYGRDGVQALAAYIFGERAKGKAAAS